MLTYILRQAAIRLRTPKERLDIFQAKNNVSPI